jgi:hypothetical protein
MGIFADGPFAPPIIDPVHVVLSLMLWVVYKVIANWQRPQAENQAPNSVSTEMPATPDALESAAWVSSTTEEGFPNGRPRSLENRRLIWRSFTMPLVFPHYCVRL